MIIFLSYKTILWIFRLKRELESKLICWDPKDGDLLMKRMKPGEILVEVRRDSDVQIDLQIC